LVLPCAPDPQAPERGGGRGRSIRRWRLMRLLFLGTGAAEEVPPVWWACANCRRIREQGGRNRRRNACAFLEPDVVIDHPPTLTSQAWDAGVDLSAVRHLVLTHGHMDHFYPHLFRWRLGDGREEPQGGAPVAPRYAQDRKSTR